MFSYPLDRMNFRIMGMIFLNYKMIFIISKELNMIIAINIKLFHASKNHNNSEMLSAKLRVHNQDTSLRECYWNKQTGKIAQLIQHLT